jgi:hypothetical protein
VQEPADSALLVRLRVELDAGEAEAIALAAELGAPVILDDRPARRRARALGLQVTGSAGVLVVAKEDGFIPWSARCSMSFARPASASVRRPMRRCCRPPTSSCVVPGRPVLAGVDDLSRRTASTRRPSTSRSGGTAVRSRNGLATRTFSSGWPRTRASIAST